MKVSIIVPVYNTKLYLNKCIDSILRQTHKDIELIIIDDGSTDGSSEICDAYKDFATVIHQENAGPSVARNNGLSYAKGEVVWFLDSDDYILPNAVEVLLPYFKDDIEVVRVGRGIPQQMFNTEDYIYPFLGGTSYFLYKKCLIDRLNLRFVPGLYVNEDGLFCMEAVMNSKGYYMASENPYIKSNRPESLSNLSVDRINKGLEMWHKECKKVIEKYKDSSSCKYIVEYLNNYISKRTGAKEFLDYFSSPQEPIDFVVTYVDNTDENWISSYKKYFPNEKANPDRFGQNDTLKYLFRSIEKNMNWIRYIYLVVSEDSQVPQWINRDNVRIVYHKDIVPSAVLPTFNSMTIEHFLYRIDGLAEKFIYANDDMFIMKKVSPRDFFFEGKPRISVRWEQANNIRMYHTSCLNAIKAIYNRTGKPLDARIQNGQVGQMEHFYLPKKKSLCERAYILCKDIIDRSLSKKRNYQNLVYTDQYLALAYNNYKDYSLTYEMIQRNKTKDTIRSLILQPSKDGLCIEYSNPDEDIVIRESFEKAFPNKSKYEI